MSNAAFSSNLDGSKKSALLTNRPSSSTPCTSARRSRSRSTAHSSTLTRRVWRCQSHLAPKTDSTGLITRSTSCTLSLIFRRPARNAGSRPAAMRRRRRTRAQPRAPRRLRSGHDRTRYLTIGTSLVGLAAAGELPQRSTVEWQQSRRQSRPFARPLADQPECRLRYRHLRSWPAGTSSRWRRLPSRRHAPIGRTRGCAVRSEGRCPPQGSALQPPRAARPRAAWAIGGGRPCRLRRSVPASRSPAVAMRALLACSS